VRRGRGEEGECVVRRFMVCLSEETCRRFLLPHACNREMEWTRLQVTADSVVATGSGLKML
jgi:hypothetical protein